MLCQSVACVWEVMVHLHPWLSFAALLAGAVSPLLGDVGVKQCYYINTFALLTSGSYFLRCNPQSRRDLIYSNWPRVYVVSNTLFHPHLSIPPFPDTQVPRLILGLEISLCDMSWGWFSPRPPAQLSIHVTSKGEMFGFIKKCEYKKKRRRRSEREWDTQTLKGGVGVRPLTYICPICSCSARARW